MYELDHRYLAEHGFQQQMDRWDLRKWMIEHNVTSVELGTALGISARTLRSWINGERVIPRSMPYWLGRVKRSSLGLVLRADCDNEGVMR